MVSGHLGYEQQNTAHTAERASLEALLARAAVARERHHPESEDLQQVATRSLPHRTLGARKGLGEKWLAASRWHKGSFSGVVQASLAVWQQLPNSVHQVC